VTAPSRHLVFVSRFAPGAEGGIQALHFDAASGVLSAGAHSGDGQVFYLAASGRADRLYSLRAERFDAPDFAEEVVAWEVTGADGALRELGRARTRGAATCYLSADGQDRFLLAANYSGGNLVSFPLDFRGIPGEAASVLALGGSGAHPTRQTSPHPHCFVALPAPDGTMHAYAADLGADRIPGYRLDPLSARGTPLDPAFCPALPGSGPRHLAVHPGGGFIYAIDELANTVTAYARDAAAGALTRLASVSALPADFRGESFGGDIVVAPDGRFLYATNRGHDSIAVFRLGAGGSISLQACIPAGGKGPQNLAFTPDGRWLLCANLPAGHVAVFRLGADGIPLACGEPFPLTAPSSLVVH